MHCTLEAYTSEKHLPFLSGASGRFMYVLVDMEDPAFCIEYDVPARARA